MDTSRPSDGYVRVAAWALGLLTAAIVLWLAAGRRYLNIAVESDFLGRFVQEAQQIAHGGPLGVDIHLPGYALLLAAVQSWAGDWLISGLAISGIAAVATLFAVWKLFTLLGGRWAGLGALGALASSALFLAFAAQAGSDVPFLAVFLWALVAAVAGMQRGGLRYWLPAGMLAAAAFLLRTNGVVLGLLVLAPLLMRASWRTRLRSSAAVAAGLAVPLMLWVGLAVRTGSPVLPTETYTNIGLTYLEEGRGCSADERSRVGKRYSSTSEILLTDPRAVARKYAADLVALPRSVLRSVTWQPIALAGALSLLFWLLRLRTPESIVVFGVAVAATLLMNMKDFQPRYYLYAAPFLGAALGLVVATILERRRAGEGLRLAALLGFCGLLGAGMGAAAARAGNLAEPQAVSAEVAAATRAVAARVPPDATLIARKHVLAHYTGRELLWFPDVTTLRELCRSVAGEGHAAPVYVFLGTAENQCRPAIAAEVARADRPAWATVVAQGGPASHPWRLVALDLRGCTAAATARAR